MLVIRTIGDTTTVRTGKRESLGGLLFELTHAVQAVCGTLANNFDMPVDKVMGALIMLLQDEDVGFVEPVTDEEDVYGMIN